MHQKISELLADLRGKNSYFSDVISFIDTYYIHTPTCFKNGEITNDPTENQGSAKVFTFASLNKLSKEDTLLLFAEHYQSVLEKPAGNDHQNIRQFSLHGWNGIQFTGLALEKRK